MRPGKRGRLAARVAIAVAAGAAVIGGMWVIFLSGDGSGVQTTNDVVWSYSSNH
jgi:hypothetical protein